ncbi:MAG: hypothetical protein GY866_29190 [Proteobacteria bacterium]|nr:hypothetical protein [Pseudomonadota bacterium]
MKLYAHHILADVFLSSHGYTQGKPTMAEPVGKERMERMAPNISHENTVPTATGGR